MDGRVSDGGELLSGVHRGVTRVLLALLVAVPLFAQPRTEIVSANDTSVTYRELVPLRVALDVQNGVYHFKGCPLIRPGMEWVAPAAAQLRQLKPHTCSQNAQPEYTTRTEKRKPRDGKVISVLFLGNSLTYFNEVARVTADVAKGEARPIREDAVTMSGASLDQLWERTPALKRLWQEHWDYVVVQERGGNAPHERGELFHKYLGMFADEIRRSGAQPLLFMTWLRADPARNEKLFFAAAARSRARLVPIGIAWNALNGNPDLDVDEVHPNAAGAYLIACTVYSTIYGKPAPAKTPDLQHLASSENYDDSLRGERIPGDVAGRIRSAAWNAVQRVNATSLKR